MKKKYNKRIKTFNTKKTKKSHRRVKKHRGVKKNHKQTKKSNTRSSYIKLSQDLMFKTYFTRDENLLRSLLKTFLPLPSDKDIEKIDILNPEIPPEVEKKKQIILDLKLELNTGEKINVEMQSAYKKGFLSRILFYWARLYTEGFKQGKEYEKLHPTYSLIFTEFSVFKQTQDVVTSFSLLSDKSPHFCLNRDLRIVFVELSKFKTRLEGLIDLRDHWCYIIRHSSQIKESELEQLAQKNKEMRKAMGLLKDMSLEDKLRWQEEDRLKAISDDKAEKAWAREEGLKEGREEGRKEGIQKGIEKGKQENLQQIVCRMLENKIDLSIIEKATGLSQMEIQKLQKKKP